jgi:hypothetical protein
MLNRRTLTAVIGIAVLAGPGCMSKRLTPAQAEKMIASELPPGTTLARAQAVLSAKGLEHSYIPATRTVLAVVRDASPQPEGSRSIHITLNFDDQGTLSSHEVKELAAGP